MLRAMSSYVYIKRRLHPGLLDNMVRGGAQAVEIFAARGHKVRVQGYWSDGECIAVDQKTGGLLGAPDGRGGGKAVGY